MDRSPEKMMNLRLRTPAGSLTIQASLDTTYTQLRAIIQETLHQNHKERQPAPAMGEEEFQILYGYPPQPFLMDDQELISLKLVNNDTLIIKFLENITKSPEQKKKSTTTSSKKTTKQTKTSSKGSKIIGNAGTNSGQRFGANIHTLNTQTSSVKKAPTKKSTAPKRKTNIQLQSEEDIGSQLINALNGGSGKSNQFLRHVFRRAVTHQYDQTKAEARVASLLSLKYSLEGNMLTRTLSTDLPTKLNVKFHKGIGSRSFYFETVDLLSVMALKAVVHILLGATNDSSDQSSAITTDSASSTSFEARSRELIAESSDLGSNRDFLRPQHLSRCSPRVFWSLVYHYGPNIPLALSQLLPNVDWSWMTSDGGDTGEGKRQITLSEKAQENARQKQLEAEEKERKKLLSNVSKKRKEDKQSAISSSRGRKRKNVEVNEAQEQPMPNVGEISPSTSGVLVYQEPTEIFSREFLCQVIQSPLCMVALYLCLNEEIGEDEPEVVSLEFFVNKVSYSSLLLALADLPLDCHSNADDDSFLVASPDMMSLLENLVNRMKKILNVVSSRTECVPFVSFSHIVNWVHLAREFVLNQFWKSLFEFYESQSSGVVSMTNSEALSRYFVTSKILHPKDLSLWRSCPGDFLEYLSHAFDSNTLMDDQPLPELSSFLNQEILCSLCLYAQSFREHGYNWSESWNCPVITNPFKLPLQLKSDSASQIPFTMCDIFVSEYLSLLECPSPESEESDPWITLRSAEVSNPDLCILYFPATKPPLPSSNELGQIVIVHLPSDNEEEETSLEEEHGEIGLVVAYLPPTEIEPMALWKVHLQRGDFIDLEEEEYHKGRQEYQQKYS